MQAASDSHGDGISYRKRLPLQWTPLQQLPSGIESERLAEANTRLLAAVALLEEHSQVGDEPSAHELELLRIHQKLNLLLELFGGFLTQQSPRRTDLMVRLSWRGIVWEDAATVLKVGEVGLVELNLSNILPQALRLPARITSVAEGVVSAEFDALTELCQSALERHVFMRHRREVAETRQPARQVSRDF